MPGRPHYPGCLLPRLHCDTDTAGTATSHCATSRSRQAMVLVARRATLLQCTPACQLDTGLHHVAHRECWARNGKGVVAAIRLVPFTHACCGASRGVVCRCPLGSRRVHSPTRQPFDVHQSPLAWLRSFRVHPDYSAVCGYALSDPRFSHRIDPLRTFCRKELTKHGCTNAQCTFQHFRAVAPMSSAEIALELARCVPGRWPRANTTDAELTHCCVVALLRCYTQLRGAWLWRRASYALASRAPCAEHRS